MENILHDFNENVEGGLSNFTDDLNDKLMKLGYDLTKFALEYAEDVIFNLKERKVEYESLEKDDRKIITIFGVINFKRRYYLDKEKNERVYLLDEYFKIAPKERLLENVSKLRLVKADNKEISEIVHNKRKIIEFKEIEKIRHCANEKIKESINFKPVEVPIMKFGTTEERKFFEQLIRYKKAV